ncbi:MAG: CAP domain-containing protein [Aeromicrobium sp.]
MLAVLATAVIACSAWLVPAGAAAPAASPASTYADTAFRATNNQRVAHDRVKLRKDTCLTRLAQRWAKHMARTRELEHQDLDPVVDRCNLSWAGENIAMGYPTGRRVVRGWMNSPGHKANILRKQYRLMGIGAAKDKNGRWWSAQVFGRR